jgi:hypothetical protein
VGYDSGDDSENVEDSPSRRPQNEFDNEHDNTQKKDVEANFASEWESFEKLIQASNDDAKDPHSDEDSFGYNVLGSKCDLKQSQYMEGPSFATGSASKQVLRPKRVFKESVEDSDHSSTGGHGSSSEEDLPSSDVRQYTNPPAKISRKSDRSSSSFSSTSSGHQLQRKSTSVSDEDASDNDAALKKPKLPETEERHSSDMSCDSSSDDGDISSKHKPINDVRNQTRQFASSLHQRRHHRSG